MTPLGYIDAGSGSMLIQVVLAGLLAVPFFFRRAIGDTWDRIRGVRSGQAPEPVQTDGEEQQPPLPKP